MRSGAACWFLFRYLRPMMGRSKGLMRFVVSAVLELVMLLPPNPTLSCRDELLSGGPRMANNCPNQRTLFCTSSLRTKVGPPKGDPL